MKFISRLLFIMLLALTYATASAADNKQPTTAPAKPGLVTFHIGNSLTGTTGKFGMYATTAGYKHSYTSFIRGGALTKRLWETEVTKEKTTYKEGKPIRVLPSGIAMGWICDMIERGQVPGIDPKDFWVTFFGKDGVHPNGNGAFLVDCTWFGAFYRESPEGKVAPVSTTWTPEQTHILQRLAWDVIENYPDCGIYSAGKDPVGKPQFNGASAPISDITPVTLASSTPGAWFRYTLDGTTPTPTRGYLYCGVISARPGMTVKAIAFKNQMAESEVAEITCPAGERNRELFHATGIGMHALDLSITGPFGQYVRHNGTQLPDSALNTQVLSVGAPGQTLWVSGMVRRGADKEASAELILDSQTGKSHDAAKSIAAGCFAKDCWGLRAGDRIVSSEVPAEAGKATRLVLRLDYDGDPDKPAHLSLFVNPSGETASKPQATIEVPPHFEWHSVGLSGVAETKGQPQDLRVGESFGAVTAKGK